MKNGLGKLGLVVPLLLYAGTATEAGIYRIVPSEADVVSGATIPLTAEVMTELGDNTVGVGYFSFALDLTISGTAGGTGAHISEVFINEAEFDDLVSNALGFPQGNRYLGVAGATLNLDPPTFGQDAGAVTRLFDFFLTVPEGAAIGDTITITPSEGTLENLIADASFNNVAPQNFQPATLTVIPEPGTLTLVAVSASLLIGRRKRERGPNDWWGL